MYHNMKALKHKGLGLLIITAGLFLFLLTTRSFWLPFAARWLMVGDKDLHPVDVIIVLSGEQGERVATGVKLYQEGLAPRLLMTGGPVEWNVAAADIMAEQAKFLGVPEKDIVLEKRATSTYENALCSLNILKKNGWHSAIVVTSPYHLRRTRMTFNNVFRGSGIRLSFYGAEDPWLDPTRWWLQDRGIEVVGLEYFKLAWYVIHNGI
ncbi:YdcF family protein [Moorella sp. Hama-1]|uniref:YdcF family protein n=1 Tax=Moorella sp. Hama-1 TaxID=2138101 RepID=UPI001F2F17F5|nr:YdcF family protein [Moorella sp. Hama-1]